MHFVVDKTIQPIRVGKEMEVRTVMYTGSTDLEEFERDNFFIYTNHQITHASL